MKAIRAFIVYFNEDSNNNISLIASAENHSFLQMRKRRVYYVEGCEHFAIFN